MKFDSVIPILYCSDIQKSFAFYTEQLGLEKRWDWGNPVDFGAVGKDGIEFFLWQHPKAITGMCIAINLDNVDEYYEFIRDKGAKILSVPTDMEWNMREMMVADPDGNLIRFGHRTDCD